MGGSTAGGEGSWKGDLFIFKDDWFYVWVIDKGALLLGAALQKASLFRRNISAAEAAQALNMPHPFPEFCSAG